MNVAAWIVQGLLALLFIRHGFTMLFVPDVLPEQMAFIRDLPALIRLLVGLGEIAGAVGLVAPLATGISPRLTPLSAIALLPIMLGAAGFHLARTEYSGSVMNVVISALLVAVAYYRWTAED